jgi:hypothetical protein
MGFTSNTENDDTMKDLDDTHDWQEASFHEGFSCWQCTRCDYKVAYTSSNHESPDVHLKTPFGQCSQQRLYMVRQIQTS